MQVDKGSDEQAFATLQEQLSVCEAGDVLHELYHPENEVWLLDPLANTHTHMHDFCRAHTRTHAHTHLLNLSLVSSFSRAPTPVQDVLSEIGSAVLTHCVSSEQGSSTQSGAPHTEQELLRRQCLFWMVVERLMQVSGILCMCVYACVCGRAGACIYVCVGGGCLCLC